MFPTLRIVNGETEGNCKGKVCFSRWIYYMNKHASSAPFPFDYTLPAILFETTFIPLLAFHPIAKKEICNCSEKIHQISSNLEFRSSTNFRLIGIFII